MVNVGVIGCGSIGRDHIERMSQVIAGVEITQVYDVVPEAAANAITDFDLAATVADSAQALISSADVDAVVIASRNDAHLEPLLASIAAGKPVFTEKPMTINGADSRQVVDAEVAVGRKFVQVGFNRRFDPGYIQLKQIVDSGEIGALLLAGCRHYNVAPATSYYATDNVVNDTLIHEIDVMRYLFDEDYRSIEIKIGRRNSLNPAPNLDEPQLAIFEMQSGALITVEANVNCQYGYDIQCRLVGESGIASLPDVATPEVRRAGQISRAISDDWTARFVDAYNAEFRAFVNSVTDGVQVGPTAWDGYVASLTADAALVSLHEKRKVEIEVPDRPALYA